MRIVFFGTPEIAVPSLKTLAEHHDVTALVCQPDKPRGRSNKLVPPPTKRVAEDLGIPVQQPTKLNDGVFEDWLRGQAPDLCALVAYGRILKQPILDVPRHGFLNVHPSKLPAYRGPAPVQGALRDGLAETAVTIMKLDAGMDTGPILLQRSLPIAPDDTAETLSARAAAAGAALLLEAVGLVKRGEAEFTPQDDSAATYTKMLTKKDGRIRWSDSADAIRNLVRAANPWPMAQCTLDGKPVRVLAAEVVPGKVDAPPGTVVHLDKKHLHVATGDGLLSITQLQVAGKRPVSAAEFLNGARIAEDDRFGEVG